jgi:tubulin monoglycylase TTLL3/8
MFYFTFQSNCYLKFSSQEFCLENLHEKIHLTNNSIQRFYANGPRSTALPPDNMWNLNEFIAYLKCQKHEHVWKNNIFPKIKKNLLAVILASLEVKKFIFSW